MLELREISKNFGETKVLNKVNFTLKASESASIVGPSGSGKSTLLYISSFLEKPSSGKVIINGKELLSETEILNARREYFGFIYQFHNLVSELTAIENARIHQQISGKRNEEFVKFLMEKAGIYNERNRKPALLSGGQCQRVAIVRALATKPKLIFADEPTGNLDPETAENSINLLLSLTKEQGASLLLVTHNYDFAKKTDSIYKMINHAPVIVSRETI
jgi:lipoprotein-releasing system ATP-binding protein